MSKPQFVTPWPEIADVSAMPTTASTPPQQSDQPRQLVAFEWSSRDSGQATVSGRLTVLAMFLAGW